MDNSLNDAHTDALFKMICAMGKDITEFKALIAVHHAEIRKRIEKLENEKRLDR